MFAMIRIKNCIMTEYKKKHMALEQSLVQKQDISAKRLDERRIKKKKTNALCYNTEDDTGENLLGCISIPFSVTNFFSAEVQDEDLSALSQVFNEFENKICEGQVDFEAKYKEWYSAPSYLYPEDEKSNRNVAAAGKSSGGGWGSGNFSVSKRGYHLPPLEGVESKDIGSSVQQILIGKQKETDTASRVEKWMQQRNKYSDKKDAILETHNIHQENLVRISVGWFIIRHVIVT